MSQSLAKVYLHAVFSTKNREPILQEAWRNELFDVMGGAANNLGCQSMIVGGVADHVHILFQLSRTITISDAIGKIKSTSSLWINQTQKLETPFHWQSGYAVFSVSQSLLEQVREYIQLQPQHHEKRSFQDELREWLVRYEVQWDSFQGISLSQMVSVPISIPGLRSESRSTISILISDLGFRKRSYRPRSESRESGFVPRHFPIANGFGSHRYPRPPIRIEINDLDSDLRPGLTETALQAAFGCSIRDSFFSKRTQSVESPSQSLSHLLQRQTPRSSDLSNWSSINRRPRITVLKPLPVLFPPRAII